MKRTLLSVLILGLVGCANMPDDRDERGYLWYNNAEPIPQSRWIYQTHSVKKIAELCTVPNVGIKALACVYRIGNLCLILLPPNPAAWLVKHEERHCEGWNHEPTRKLN